MILNAVLSKNTFEYILINKSLEVISSSEGVALYTGEEIKVGREILEYLPELLGSEEDIRNIFTHPKFTYILDSISRKEYYLNISAEYYSSDTVLILLHNITEITLSKQKLLQYSNESILLNNTLEKILNKQNALLFVCTNEEIVYANQKFIEYFNVDKIENFKKQNFALYRDLDDSFNSYEALFNEVNSKEKYVTINKDTFILQATLIEATHNLFTLTKITNLSNEMHIDPLTGLYRKGYFNIQLEKLLENNEFTAIVVLDLDDFKKINDTYGHLVGDEVLKEFSDLVQANIRGVDLFARWGGEEFLLLLKHTNIENAIKKLENIRKLIASHNFNHIGYLTVSFGMAYSHYSDDVNSVLQRADNALYEAKSNGKNQVVYKSE